MVRLCDERNERTGATLNFNHIYRLLHEMIESELKDEPPFDWDDDYTLPTKPTKPKRFAVKKGKASLPEKKGEPDPSWARARQALKANNTEPLDNGDPFQD